MDRVSEYLKAQREARGVSLEQLSKGTLISVAVLKDIEGGRFDKYKGDELYVKMYLKRIAEFLEIDSHELIDDYVSLTQEIQLEDLRKKEEKIRLQEEKRGNVTFVGKLGETIREIKPTSSPLQKRKAKRVYEDNYIARYFKYGLIILLCAVIIFVIWYSIVASKSGDNTPYTPPSSGDVEKNPDAPNEQEKPDVPKENENQEATAGVVLTNAGGSAYEVAGLKAGDTLKIEVTFKAPGHFNLWKGSTQIEGASKAYIAEETYVYETPVAIGDRYYFNFWNLSNAVIKINGHELKYDPATVTVIQGGVSSISLLMKGE